MRNNKNKKITGKKSHTNRENRTYADNDAACGDSRTHSA